MAQAELVLTQDLKSIMIKSPEENVHDYDWAVNELNLDKSPGFPYYFDCQTKAEALALHGDDIRQEVNRLISGEKRPCVFACTEKSELRPREKVLAKKTRVFNGSNITHLIAAKMLFEEFNIQLMKSIGDHPITIGIRIPGPDFVMAMNKLGDRGNEADLDGCDQGFHPRVARSIRNIRNAFIPSRYHKCSRYLYDTVYAGYVAVLGFIYRMDGNKSGWNNTGFDNSLYVWLAMIIAALHFAPHLHWSTFWILLINGDDLAARLKYKGADGKLTFKEVADWLAQFGFVLTANDFAERAITDLVYLSHHLEKRFVPRFGDFLVAAGNLPKLRSSLNWIKPNHDIGWEASCVAHLIGVRLCLFPWAVEFEECDLILSNYLASIVRTPFINAVLQARFSEFEMALLHTKYEGVIFSPDYESVTAGLARKPLVHQVLKGLRRLIKNRLSLPSFTESIHKLKRLSYQAMSSTQKQVKKPAAGKPKNQPSDTVAKSEYDNLKKEVDKLRAAQKKEEKKPATVATVLKEAAKQGLKWVVGEPLKEIVVDLASAVFGQDLPQGRLKRHRGLHTYAPHLEETTPVPAGTILFSASISPHMCRLDENRLTQMASVRSFYEFTQGYIEQVPSESAFVGGSVAMFIVPDPDLEVVVTDLESVQALVTEFNGVVTRIDKKGRVKIPPPQRELSARSPELNTPTPRDYFQGVFYAVAFSEIPAEAVLPAFALSVIPKWAGNNVPGVDQIELPPQTQVFSGNCTWGANGATLNQILTPSLTLGSSFVTVTGTTYAIPPGIYQFDCQVNYTGTANCGTGAAVTLSVLFDPHPLSLVVPVTISQASSVVSFAGTAFASDLWSSAIPSTFLVTLKTTTVNTTSVSCTATVTLRVTQLVAYPVEGANANVLAKRVLLDRPDLRIGALPMGLGLDKEETLYKMSKEESSGSNAGRRGSTDPRDNVRAKYLL